MQLFKFLDAQYGLQNIHRRRLKVSEFIDMNDPLELCGLSIGDEKLQRAMKVQLSKFGMLCLTRAWTDPLLWGHYADKHKGICLGFELPDSVPCYEPIYVEMPEVFSGELAGVLDDSDPGTFSELVRKMLLLKYQRWNYENEIRIMTTLDSRDGAYAFRAFDEEHLTLREVIIGVRGSDENVQQVRDAVAAYSDRPRIYRAALRPDHFEMWRSEV